MPFSVTMPKLSPTMEAGTIVKWHADEGSLVKSGDLLIEVATDKATVEYNALDGGFLRKIVVPEGSDAAVNECIAIFSESADDSIDELLKKTAAPAETSKEEEVKEETKSEAASQTKRNAVPAMPTFAPLPPVQKTSYRPRGMDEGRAKVSPLARRLAKEKGVDISSIAGSGPGGRVVARDLENAASSGSLSLSREDMPSIPSGTYEAVSLSPMRKVIGERLQASKMTIPHFYVQQEINVRKLIQVREDLLRFGVKLTYNDFIVRACALALRKHPKVNSGFDAANNQIIYFKTIDISIAVSLPDGLITPIVRYADFRSVEQLSAEVKRLAAAAKEGVLKPEEFQGGSFTISNLGMFGINDFQAVINPPQSAILAVGGIVEKPVVENGVVTAGKTMMLSLSSDHRVVDGADAAQFMKTLQELLENPSILFL